MKLKIIILVLGIIANSCSKSNDEPKVEPLDLLVMEFPQRWDLFQMSSGMVPNLEITGDEIEYKEYYIFYKDNTFSKTRIQDQEVITEKGSYSIAEMDNRQAFRLRFNQDNDLIGNCSMEPVEFLYLDDDNKTLLSNWWACDGPGLFYAQTEIK